MATKNNSLLISAAEVASVATQWGLTINGSQYFQQPKNTAENNIFSAAQKLPQKLFLLSSAKKSQKQRYFQGNRRK
jgi:hypothetical protein